MNRASKRSRHSKMFALSGCSINNQMFRKLLVNDQKQPSEAVETNERKKWQCLARKEKLSAIEMMSEAAFTELLNKESLAKL